MLENTKFYWLRARDISRISLCRPGHQPFADRRTREAIGFGVVLTVYVRDGEVQGTSQFPADPIQRVKARAAARVFALHLPNDDFGIRVNVQFPGFESNGTL